MPATPPRCRPHCLTHHERVEWLALSRLRYLTNLTNSRVRSTHPFHTKSPFSRFLGGRRQKSENIVVSARGRRRPQAPTLRISGCANARKYDYKSSSLYSQSSVVSTHSSQLQLKQQQQQYNSNNPEQTPRPAAAQPSTRTDTQIGKGGGGARSPARPPPVLESQFYAGVSL